MSDGQKRCGGDFMGRRQPKRVTLTIEGEAPDVRDMHYKLQRWLSNQPFDVDYQIEGGKSVLFIHPWAIND